MHLDAQYLKNLKDNNPNFNQLLEILYSNCLLQNGISKKTHDAIQKVTR